MRSKVRLRIAAINSQYKTISYHSSWRGTQKTTTLIIRGLNTMKKSDKEKELKELEMVKNERIPGYNVPIPGLVDLSDESQSNDSNEIKKTKNSNNE